MFLFSFILHVAVSRGETLFLRVVELRYSALVLTTPGSIKARNQADITALASPKMPVGDKKWDMAAERDLSVAIILANNEGKPSYNWPKVYAIMESIGYSFTKDAIRLVTALSPFPHAYSMKANCS